MDFLHLFNSNLQYLLPELFICLGIFTILIYGVLNSTSFKINYPILSRNVLWLSALIVIFAVLITINQGIFGDSGSLFYGMLKVDSWTQVTKMFILLSTLASLIMSLHYLQAERLNDFEYSILILLALLGMMFIISSYDLMSLYMAIELQSLSLYVLACFKRNSLLSVESGLKYFVLGAFSSGLLLFGISMVYGFTGSTHFEDISKLVLTLNVNELVSFNSGITLGLLFMLVGLLFKVYAVPFHQWVPDVYQGSPTSVTAFFAVAPSLSVYALLVKFLYVTFYDLIFTWQPILIVCSILSIVVGSLGAIYQVKIKRFIAYSAISHVGYILMALATGSISGVESLMFYIIVYIVMNITLFSIIMSVRRVRSSKQTYSSVKNNSSEGEIEFIEDFQGLGKIKPTYAIIISIILFSMAGIPPLAGFFSKLYVFFSAIQQDLIALVFVGIIGSVLSAVYYLKIIRLMYFSNANTWITYAPLTKERAYLISIGFLFISAFFIYPDPLLIFIHKVLSVL